MGGPTNPSWKNPNNINNGKEYTQADGVTYVDMNSIIEDLLYLKANASGTVTLVELIKEIINNGDYTYDAPSGQAYNKVSIKVNVPSTGVDVSDTTATADKVLSGFYFYNSTGSKTQGTIATYTGVYENLR